jgi:hypothetical protein
MSLHSLHPRTIIGQELNQFTTHVFSYINVILYVLYDFSGVIFQVTRRHKSIEKKHNVFDVSEIYWCRIYLDQSSYLLR